MLFVLNKTSNLQFTYKLTYQVAELARIMRAFLTSASIRGTYFRIYIPIYIAMMLTGDKYLHAINNKQHIRHIRNVLNQQPNGKNEQNLIGKTLSKGN